MLVYFTDDINKMLYFQAFCHHTSISHTENFVTTIFLKKVRLTIINKGLCKVLVGFFEVCFFHNELPYYFTKALSLILKIFNRNVFRRREIEL